MRRRALPPIELGRLTTHSLYDRPSTVQAAGLGRPLGRGATVDQLLEALPDQLAGRLLRRWRDVVCTAVHADRPVVAALGGHVIKTGCAPYLIDWIRRGVLTAVAMNGSAAIHDFELAFAGKTSENVSAQLPKGEFGMARETADAFAVAAHNGAENDIGLGWALGRHLDDMDCPHNESSL